jgi:hypothetical protein
MQSALDRGTISGRFNYLKKIRVFSKQGMFKVIYCVREVINKDDKAPKTGHEASRKKQQKATRT